MIQQFQHKITQIKRRVDALDRSFNRENSIREIREDLLVGNDFSTRISHFLLEQARICELLPKEEIGPAKAKFQKISKDFRSIQQDFSIVKDLANKKIEAADEW